MPKNEDDEWEYECLTKAQFPIEAMIGDSAGGLTLTPECDDFFSVSSSPPW